MAQRPTPLQSVRFTLLALLAAVLILTLVVVGSGSYQLVAVAERELWHQRQEAVARSAGQTVGDFLSTAGEALTALGAVDAAQLAADSALPAALLASQPALIELIRTDADGVVFAAAARDQALLSNMFTLAQATWFQQARAGGLYISSVQLSSRDEPYLILARAAPDGGVVAARLDLQVLRGVVDELRGESAGQAYVFQRGGRLLVASDDDAPDDVTTLAGRPELPLLIQIAADGTSASYVNYEGEAVFGTAAPVAGADLLLVTEVPEELTHQASRGALTILAGGLLVFGAVALGLAGALLSWLILRPLRTLQRGAEALARGELAVAIPLRRQDELGAVAGAFNLMADAVRTREHQLHDLAASLEQQVLARTADLRHESEQRERLQAETVRQAEALVALSMPLIPISDEVLVLPVIGAVDGERLGQIQATLLGGVERQRARTVILDLTGVALIDEAGAAGLLEATRMLGLLGVGSIITGISPEIAQTLVGLGARLDHLGTYSTLQEAIAAALLRAPAPRRLPAPGAGIGGATLRP